eukprot:TRINITY_DN12758_c0_g3_i1.p1 TRINITY_DN12758_c0_g3~~TRINITY_DN12758_c0_g3_i1.p1  ORF type:complete len:686 (+),score=123.77 TRINITY_DN12758_c0_g3_i1:291-2060(+)
MSRAWSPLRMWHCSKGSGSGPEEWTSTEMPPPSRPPSIPEAPGPSVALTGGDKLVRTLQASLVTIRFRTDQRFCTEALDSGSSEGVGLLVDAEKGIVLTDRHSAPQSLGDIEVTLAGSATVDGEVFFVHPQHNLALIKCDPVALAALRKGKVPLQSARLAKGTKACLRAGEDVHFVGFDSQNNTFSTEVKVAAVYLPSGKDEFPTWTVPRFRERNLEIVVLADTPEDARGGVLCDASGQIRGFFGQFDWQGPRKEETTEAFGIPANVFAPLLEAVKKNPEVKPQVRSLDLDVSAVDVSTLARGAAGKLPKKWMEAVFRRCGQQGQVARAIRVGRVLSTGASEGYLRPGDVLLSVGSRTIACALDVEEALWSDSGNSASSRGAKPSGSRDRSKSAGGRGKSEGGRSRSPRGRGMQKDGSGGSSSSSASTVTIRVFRDGAEVDVEVKPSVLSSEDDQELLIWAGLVLRRTPRCILERCGESVAPLAGGVFIQTILGGSPADTCHIHPHCFLMEMDGHPIRDLADVVKYTPVDGQQSDQKPSRHGPWIRIQLLDMNGQEHVKAIQRDTLFHPTLHLRSSPTGRWTCHQKIGE